jgi:phage terminase large subunit GpA-like protein
VRGHPVRYWFKPSGKRNEALDRRVYALAALHARPVPGRFPPRRTDRTATAAAITFRGRFAASIIAATGADEPFRPPAHSIQDEIKGERSGQWIKQIKQTDLG